MLIKNTEIEIPADNPFINDKLDRKKIAENLTSLVQSTNQPFVISIQAPWGWGKTTFIKMWKTHLESLGHTCLYFNAWENDFVEDPLIAFVGEINKILAEKKAKGKMGAQLKKLQSIGGKIVRRALPLTIQIATQGLLSQETVKKVSDVVFTSGDEIASFASELAEEKIKQYENDKNGILEFKKELAGFTKSLSEEENKKTPLVFFIDELDRCRPDFSISLLERIKHVFSVEGIVFVLGMDRGQIEQSVKSLYGQAMDEDGYLRRFIDFSINLPKPTAESFCRFLFDRFLLHEVFSSRKNGNDEQDALLRTFMNLAQSYSFSLRVIEQCFTEINLILRTTPSNIRIYPYLLPFLVAFKAYKPKSFSLLENELSYLRIKELLVIIREDIDIRNRTYLWMLAQFEALLIYGYLEHEDNRKEAFEALKLAAESKNVLERDYAQRVLKFGEQIEFDLYYGAIKHLVSKLNLVEGLTK
jgi:hypothetical protein